MGLVQSWPFAPDIALHRNIEIRVFCFLHLFWQVRLFFPFFFLRFVRARVLGALHRGRAGRRRGRQRVVASRGGVTRSAVAVLVARRRVCLETQGKHEWALSGLLMWFRSYCVRVYKVRCDVQNNIQAVLIFAAKLKSNERATHSEY